jgi:site-specific recombinase XerD
VKLHTAVTQYIAYRKSLGECFLTNARMLNAFVHEMGHKINIADVKPDSVSKFLAGTAPIITANWHGKHQALRGFYRYALSRGHVKTSPLPTTAPKRPQPFVPYIYNVKELQSLLDASLTYQKNRSCIRPKTIRSLLLLLYGAGLRIREALLLTLADVNFPQKLLTIRQTKFRKSRLVPIGDDLVQNLAKYDLYRRHKKFSQNPEDPFFIDRKGGSLGKHTIENIFQRIREKAGIGRNDGARYQPRLHDLRHSFAVHRLTTWYQEGADVQKLLPVLSVYLGHTYLAATSTYLTMTPTLLEEAGHRFEHYALKEVCHD